MNREWDELMREVEEAPYEWHVVPSGRWSWFVRVNHGLIGRRDGWIVVGSRDRAVRKGQRECARWRREDERSRRLRVSGDV